MVNRTIHLGKTPVAGGGSVAISFDPATIGGLNANLVWSSGNTRVTKPTGSGISYTQQTAASAKTTGKWYFELKATVVGGTAEFYPVNDGANNCAVNPTGAAGVGTITNNNTAGTITYTSGDVMGFAIDFDAKKLFVSKNGTFGGTQNPATGANPTMSWSAIGTSQVVVGINPPSEDITLAGNAGNQVGIPPAGFTHYDGADTTTGLKSNWAMNEGSGTTVADSVGSHTLTFVNAVSWDVDNSPIASSANQSMFCSDHADFLVTTAFTAFGWVKGAAQNGSCFMGQYDINAGTPNRSWSIGITDSPASTTLRAVLTDAASGGNFKVYNGSQTIADNNWHSACIRWNNGTLDIFVDGVKDTSVTHTTDNALTANSVFNSAGDIRFFNLSDSIGGSSTGAPWGGNLRKWRFYNIAKSDADITAIHALG